MDVDTDAESISVSGVSGVSDNERAGNTRETARSRSRIWVFTYNNPSVSGVSAVSWGQLLESAGADRYIFQLEQGVSGTEHFQGVVSFRNQVSFSTLRQLDGSVHWERCKNFRASIAYCSKRDDTYRAGPWRLGIDEPIQPIQPVIALRVWQANIVSFIEQQLGGGVDDRRIVWLCDDVGGLGKTFLAKYLIRERRTWFTAYCNGRAADVKCAIAKLVGANRSPRLVLFDLNRCNEHFSYEAIESVKNGLFFSGKYESAMVTYDVPVVLVFSNTVPDFSKLSADRWAFFRRTGYNEDDFLRWTTSPLTLSPDVTGPH